MTLTLNLPPEIEQGLIARAHARGTALAAFAQEVLAREAEPTQRPRAAPAGIRQMKLRLRAASRGRREEQAP